MRHILFICNQLVGIVIIAITVTWLAKYRGFGWDDTSKQFSWHPLFMILGFVYFFGNAVIIFRVFPRFEKYSLKLLHTIIHGLAVLSVLFALYVIVDEKIRSHKSHFLTFHSWLGIATLALFVLQWILSVLIFLFQLTSAGLRALLFPWHLWAGRVIFLLAFSTIATGLKGKTEQEQKLVNGLGISIVVYALIIFYIMSRPDLKYVTK